MDQVPQQTQGILNSTAVVGAWASFAGVLKDWLGVGAAALSIVWLGCQIYSWYEKRKEERAGRK